MKIPSTKIVAADETRLTLQAIMGVDAKSSEQSRVFTKHPRLSEPEEALLRTAHQEAGDHFQFVRFPALDLGYYIEPWTNDCLTGSKLTPDQPEPVSLDRSDEQITEDEASIRNWIDEVAHLIVVPDIARRAPAGWTVQAHGYFDDWNEIEFGATVLLFKIAHEAAPQPFNQTAP